MEITYIEFNVYMLTYELRNLRDPLGDATLVAYLFELAAGCPLS